MEKEYLETDKKIVAEIYTSSEPMDNLKILCDDFGSRFPGTSGDYGSVKFMVGKLESYGIDNAHHEVFSIPGWVRGPAKLEITSPIEKEIGCISLPLGLAGEVESKLVFLEDGPIEIYEKLRKDIEGNIVMVTSRTPLGMKRPLHRTEKYMRSILAGAKGWIFMNHYPAYGPPTGGISPVIPALGVSFEDGSFLSRLLEKEKDVKLKITTTDQNLEVKTYNVVCDIPGTTDDKQYVLSGSHYDGHDISQGAVDPASGAVTIMEIARVLHKVKNDLKRRVRLLCFGAEEIGLFGSYNYVSMYEDELDNLRFMLNLDSGGRAGKKGVILHGHPELEAFFQQIAKEMKDEIPLHQRVSPYSDHWPFFLKGVPTGSGGDPENLRTRTGRGYGHTRFDTVDKVELQHLRSAASNYSRVLLRIANTDDWPAKRKTPEEIEKFIEEQGYNQTIVLAEKVKEYVKDWSEIHPDTRSWLERKSNW